MEVKDLMTGDYVQHKRTKEVIWIFEIDADRNVINNESDGYCSEKNISIDDIEPIPLTPEILEKNGWINEHFGTQRQEWWLDKTKFPVVKYSTNSHFQHNGIVLSYVHELQHALRLCGQNDLADNFKI